LINFLNDQSSNKLLKSATQNNTSETRQKSEINRKMMSSKTRQEIVKSMEGDYKM